MCECATRIYHDYKSQLYTHGDDAQPTIDEVLETAEIQVLQLKIGIIEERIKKLSQSIRDALEQDDIEKYKKLNQEKTRWMGLLREGMRKMRE